MQTKPTLIIMAAGMGSRFGGLKQLTPVGPNGQMIIDYSIYDAVLSGFGKVVFVIKHAIEKEFKSLIGDRVAQKVTVEYVFQELDKLPEGYTVPDGREKPWGTGHAILCCRDVVHEPFMVINADDFYGRETYQLLADFLRNAEAAVQPLPFAMVAYQLKNTLTENGYVSRGVCSVNEQGTLCGLTERTHIEITENGPAYTEDGVTYVPLSEDTPVSMNAWAFPREMLDHLETRFCRFLDTTAKENPLKAEFYLPFAVDDMMADGEAVTTVLTTREKWYGMTYAEDKADVQNAIAQMTADGIYPETM